jgi:hypothetical protein
MLKRNGTLLRTVIIGMIAGLALTVSATPAFAGAADGLYKPYGPHVGFSYRNKARVVTTPVIAAAATGVEVTSADPAPVGYIGARAELYKDGALCGLSPFTYNTTPTKGFAVGVNMGDDCGAGTYYSHGVSQAYNDGGGYTSYRTFQSPNQIFPTAVGAASAGGRVDQVTAGTTNWQRNADGLTFGSATDAKTPADEPDLILAVATNGRLGYARRADLQPVAPKSPAEALATQARMAGAVQQISVYEADAKTRIGVFIISHDA